MRRALQLARRGKGSVSPNPLVGAVYVRDGMVIAEGWHRRYGADHAEVDALKRAPGGVKGATLYVTLEPCSHWGKTPPCCEALVAQGISRAVIATLDPNPLVAGKGAQYLREHGVEVTVGTLEKEALRLNEVYFHYMLTALPFVTVKYAQSLDGRIATTSGASRWISSEQARSYAHRLRAEHDAVMIGIGTAIADDPELTVRLVKGRDPLRICLDSKLRIPLDARLLRGETPTLIVTTVAEMQGKVQEIERRGKEVLILPPTAEGRVPIRPLLERLATRGVTSILVEGGARVVTSLLREGFVERIVVITSPIILGRGTEAIGDLGISELKDALRPASWQLRRVGGDVVFDMRF